MSHDTKYGKITTEHKTIPPDEPCFLLRGQDELAWRAVEYYAASLRNRMRAVAAEEVNKIAKAMRDWPTKKMPD